MTDEIGALSALMRTNSSVRHDELRAFYAKWKDEALVMNKWFMLQATSPVDTALADVERLSEDAAFDKNNPNTIASLFTAFARANPTRFNAVDGSGYRYIAERVIDIDSRNPQVASRLASCFNQWRLLDPSRRELVQSELKRVLAKPGLSSNVFEIVSKALAN